MNLFGHIDKSVDAPTITRQTHEVRLESDDVVNDIHAQRLRALGDVEIDAMNVEMICEIAGVSNAGFERSEREVVILGSEVRERFITRQFGFPLNGGSQEHKGEFGGGAHRWRFARAAASVYRSMVFSMLPWWRAEGIGSGFEPTCVNAAP